jgi:SAM-dependent methyltransferase
MRHPDLKQWQTLELMIQKQLADHPARDILWLGIGTGNGLSYVPSTVEHVYGVDCNPEFLDICRQRHGDAVPGLELHCLDLNQESLSGPRVDMIMASLVLEFLDPEAFLRQVNAVHISDTIVSVIFQERRSVKMVSSSGVKAMQVLSGFHREVDRDTLIQDLSGLGYRLQYETESVLPDGKVFRRLDLRRG